MAWAASSIFGIGEVAAHGLDGPPHAENVLVENGAIQAIPTSFGLVTRVGDDWRWTPEALVRGTVATSARLDGRTLLGTTEGLFATSDGGCTRTGPPELVGSSVLTILTADERVWVGTEASSQPSGLFVSDDGGATFQPTELFGPEIRVSGIASTRDGLWAGGFDAASRAWTLWLDRGDGFAAQPLDGDPLRIRVFAARAADVLVAVETGVGWRLELRGDAGVAQTFTVGAEPVDAEFVGDGVHYVSAAAELRDATTDEVLSPAVYCIEGAYLCRSVDVSQQLVEGGDAGWAAVQPASCEGEAQAVVDANWPTAQAAGYGPRAVSPSSDPPTEGCCRTARATRGAPWWCFAGLVLMMRRRAAKMSA